MGNRRGRKQEEDKGGREELSTSSQQSLLDVQSTSRYKETNKV